MPKIDCVDYVTMMIDEVLEQHQELRTNKKMMKRLSHDCGMLDTIISEYDAVSMTAEVDTESGSFDVGIMLCFRNLDLTSGDAAVIFQSAKRADVFSVGYVDQAKIGLAFTYSGVFESRGITGEADEEVE